MWRMHAYEIERAYVTAPIIVSKETSELKVVNHSRQIYVSYKSLLVKI